MKVGVKSIILSGVLAATACATSANAGEWRFHANRCPDLVEDRADRRESRRDERYDRGPLDRLEDRADRRESRRDERVTVCPASAWVWHGPRGRAYRATPRPARVAVYYDAAARGYYRVGSNRARVAIVIK